MQLKIKRIWNISDTKNIKNTKNTKNIKNIKDTNKIPRSAVLLVRQSWYCF